MTHQPPQALLTAPPRDSHVPAMKYAMDVTVGSGIARPTMALEGIAGVAVSTHVMGDVGVCPVSCGACVSSTTGGLVQGYDMYGQYIEETVAAEGTSTIAFAGILAAPADAVWADQYGLPYKYAGAAADAPAGVVTYTEPASDEDARGTFALDTPLATGVRDEVELYYLADTENLMGDAYATRFASPDRVSAVTEAGTLNKSTGVGSITKVASSDTSGIRWYTLPDGQVLESNDSAGALAFTLSSLYISKYGAVLPASMPLKGVTGAGTPLNVTLTVS